jgi:hypothetical protein
MTGFGGGAPGFSQDDAERFRHPGESLLPCGEMVLPHGRKSSATPPEDFGHAVAAFDLPAGGFRHAAEVFCHLAGATASEAAPSHRAGGASDRAAGATCRAAESFCHTERSSCGARSLCKQPPAAPGDGVKSPRSSRRCRAGVSPAKGEGGSPRHRRLAQTPYNRADALQPIEATFFLSRPAAHPFQRNS